MPERTYRRWQAKARNGNPAKGPWPQPAREASRGVVTKHALKKPEWGHRKVWAMVRHEGHVVSQATVLRTMRDEGLLLPAEYQKQPRTGQGPASGVREEPYRAESGVAVGLLESSRPLRAAFGASPDAGIGTGKYEYPFHISPTGNQHDAIAAVELALAEYEAIFAPPSAGPVPGR